MVNCSALLLLIVKISSTKSLTFKYARPGTETRVEAYSNHCQIEAGRWPYYPPFMKCDFKVRIPISHIRMNSMSRNKEPRWGPQFHSYLPIFTSNTTFQSRELDTAPTLPLSKRWWLDDQYSYMRGELNHFNATNSHIQITSVCSTYTLQTSTL